eukprot:2676784-Rhodomonas_salina.1
MACCVVIDTSYCPHITQSVIVLSPAYLDYPKGADPNFSLTFGVVQIGRQYVYFTLDTGLPSHQAVSVHVTRTKGMYVCNTDQVHTLSQHVNKDEGHSLI